MLICGAINVTRFLYKGVFSFGTGSGTVNLLDEKNYRLGISNFTWRKIFSVTCLQREGSHCINEKTLDIFCFCDQVRMWYNFVYFLTRSQ